MARDYLRNHVVFATNDLDEARASLRAAGVDGHVTSCSLQFVGLTSNLQLKNVALTYYRWSAAEMLGEAVGGFYFVVLHEAGSGQRLVNGQKVLASPRRAALLSSMCDEVFFRIEPSQVLAVRLDKTFVDTALRQRFPGAPILDQWPRTFAIDHGPGASLRSLVRWLADALDDPASSCAPRRGRLITSKKPFARCSSTPSRRVVRA